jgi:hypothetical protein
MCWLQKDIPHNYLDKIYSFIGLLLKGHRCRLEGGWIGDIKFYEWLEQKQN